MAFPFLILDATLRVTKPFLRQALAVRRLASVVDAHRARLGAVGQYRQQIGEHGVLMLRHEPFHLVAPAPFARLADETSTGSRTSLKVTAPPRGMADPFPCRTNGGTSPKFRRNMPDIVTGLNWGQGCQMP